MTLTINKPTAPVVLDIVGPDDAKYDILCRNRVFWKDMTKEVVLDAIRKFPASEYQVVLATGKDYNEVVKMTSA